MIEKKEKTVPQALKEIIAGYDVLGNLKFLVMAFFGLVLGLNKKDKKIKTPDTLD
jgi:hypothetical protein